MGAECKLDSLRLLTFSLPSHPNEHFIIVTDVCICIIVSFTFLVHLYCRSLRISHYPAITSVSLCMRLMNSPTPHHSLSCLARTPPSTPPPVISSLQCFSCDAPRQIHCGHAILCNLKMLEQSTFTFPPQTKQVLTRKKNLRTTW